MKIQDMEFPCYLRYIRDNGKKGIMLIQDKSDLEEKLNRKDLDFPIKKELGL